MSKFLFRFAPRQSHQGTSVPTGGPTRDVSPNGPSPACEVRAGYGAGTLIARKICLFCKIRRRTGFSNRCSQKILFKFSDLINAPLLNSPIRHHINFTTRNEAPNATIKTPPPFAGHDSGHTHSRFTNGLRCRTRDVSAQRRRANGETALGWLAQTGRQCCRPKPTCAIFWVACRSRACRCPENRQRACTVHDV